MALEFLRSDHFDLFSEFTTGFWLRKYIVVRPSAATAEVEHVHPTCVSSLCPNGPFVVGILWDRKRAFRNFLALPPPTKIHSSRSPQTTSQGVLLNPPPHYPPLCPIMIIIKVKEEKTSYDCEERSRDNWAFYWAGLPASASELKAGQRTDALQTDSSTEVGQRIDTLRTYLSTVLYKRVYGYPINLQTDLRTSNRLHITGLTLSKSTVFPYPGFGIPVRHLDDFLACQIKI